MITESLERLFNPFRPPRLRGRPPCVPLNTALDALIKAEAERERQFTRRLIESHHGRDRWGTLEAAREFWKYRAANLPMVLACRCLCRLCAAVRLRGRGWAHSPITMDEVQRNADGTPNPTRFGEPSYDRPDLPDDPIFTSIATGALASVGTEA